jgi:hypothetical protein
VTASEHKQRWDARKDKLPRRSDASLADNKDLKYGDDLKMREAEEVTRDEHIATEGAQKMERNSLVLMRVNCRSILNKHLYFWNLIHTYNPDIIIGTEPWRGE